MLKQKDSVAVAARGIILEVSSESLWNLAQGFFFVTVQVSSHNSTIPRTYQNVAWPYTGAIDFWTHRPRTGDYVDIVFKGGSSENPTVVAHHPGDSTAQARLQAILPRAVVPIVSALQAAIGATPGGALLNFLEDSSIIP